MLRSEPGQEKSSNTAVYKACRDFGIRMDIRTLYLSVVYIAYKRYVRAGCNNIKYHVKGRAFQNV